jgi:glycosyltransferase involved in cell wall biosynthesis
MLSPSFDVVITTYRRPEYVLAAVRSCLGQGPHLDRVIVVDDASGDDTKLRLAGLGDPRVLYHLRTENGGMSMARHTGLALSSADWTIHLDDDWELLPGAIESFTELACRAPDNTAMLGSRMVWDTGKVSPSAVPTEPIDYDGQIRWRARADGLGADNVCAVSRLARGRENWPPVRFGWYCATLFYLDVARHGLTLYTDQVLALQKSCMIHSDSRGESVSRLARRTLDASGGITVADELIMRHYPGLLRGGRCLLSGVLTKRSMSHLLLGDRRSACVWAFRAWRIWPVDYNALSMVMFSLLGRGVFEAFYRLRG